MRPPPEAERTLTVGREAIVEELEVGLEDLGCSNAVERERWKVSARSDVLYSRANLIGHQQWGILILVEYRT